MFESPELDLPHGCWLVFQDAMGSVVQIIAIVPADDDSVRSIYGSGGDVKNIAAEDVVVDSLS